MGLIYLASPYSSPSDLERAVRREAAAKACALLSLMDIGHVYAPIVHGVGFEQYLPTIVRQDHDFWMRHCYQLLERCDQLFVLMIDGWQTSKGVQMEIEYARQMGMTTRYAVPLFDEDRIEVHASPVLELAA